MNKLLPAVAIGTAAGLIWILTAHAQQAAQPAAVKPVKFRHKMVLMALPVPDKGKVFQYPFTEYYEQAFDGWEVVSAIPAPEGTREENGVLQKLPVTLYTLRQRVE